MSMRNPAGLFAVWTLCLPALAVAGDPPVSGDAGTVAGQPDVRAILRKVDDATKAVQAVSYEAEFFGEGDIAGQVAKIHGSVKARGQRKSLLGRIVGRSDRPPSVCIEAAVQVPGSDDVQVFRVATNGERIYSVDEKERVFTYGDMPEAGRLMGAGNALIMREFLHPTPFSDELNAKSAKYEGRREIGGVPCHVIYVVYANDSESRWYFGMKDSLPRRVDRIIKAEDIDGATVLAVTKLDTKPAFEESTFRLERPKGFEKERYQPPARPKRLELLAVGTRAPDWALKVPDGKVIRLKDLRGQVVVLDFWATWCGPCKMAMPGVQKLHEEFKDRPVKVFGVNCWEKGDPAAYMKKKEYTYGLLVEADDVAKTYHVTGIPTFYVIGKDGKILYASSGFTPDSEKKIAKIIKKALKGEKP